MEEVADETSDEPRRRIVEGVMEEIGVGTNIFIRGNAVIAEPIGASRLLLCVFLALLLAVAIRT